MILVTGLSLQKDSLKLLLLHFTVISRLQKCCKALYCTSVRRNKSDATKIAAGPKNILNLKSRDTMAEVILMPRLSDTMTEGVIAGWHIRKWRCRKR